MQEMLDSRDCSLDELPPGIKLDSVTKGEGEKGYQLEVSALVSIQLGTSFQSIPQSSSL